MNSDKTIGRIVGALFLTVMVTWLIGDELIGSELNVPDYLLTLYPNKINVILGALFELIEVGAVLGIAVVMFPIFKKQNESVALGYVSFRILECAMLVVSALSPLLLITVSEKYIQAGAPQASHFHTIGSLLIETRTHWAFLLLTIFYCIAALIFYLLLYQSKLIPRLISVWGFVAVVISVLDRMVLELSGHSLGMISGLPVSGLHLGVIEIILGIWLVAKGFNPTAVVSEAV